MLINLLPHRAWARTRKRKAFFMSIWLSAMVGVLVAFGASAWLARQLEAQSVTNSSLQQAIAAVDGQLKLMSEVKVDLGLLAQRETTLQDLQEEGQLTGFFMRELAAHLPIGLYVTAMKQDGDKVHINGAARSGEEVFELLRQIVSGGQWIARPALIEVAAAPAALLSQGVPAGTPFSMQAWLQRPALSAAAAAAAGAGAQLHSSALD
jgi:type IV pilus assembly protein PilN